MVQSQPLLALGAVGDLRRQISSKNLSTLGASIGTDARDLDKFPLSG